MKKAIYILFALVFVLNSCKKKDLPKSDEDSTPVFYLRGEVNGVPLNIQAGLNGYFMTASHYQDQNDVYVYKGELRQAGCTNGCGYSLAILINDHKFSPAGTSMQADSGLARGTYVFSSGNTNPQFYTGSFVPLSGSSDTQFQWHYSDGVNSSASTASRQLDANKTYTVSLSSSDPRGCITSHANVFKVGNLLQTNIKGVYQDGTYTFSADSGATGIGPYRYLWDFGDGTTTTAANPSHAFSQPGYFTTRLTLTDANNNTCDSYFQVNGDNTCQANFLSSFKPVPNSKALSAVTILVTDPSGAVYSSNDVVQSTDSKFEIVSVEEYEQNAQGEPTKKLKISFNCNLTSSSGPITIKNGEAVIAVSYK